MECRSVNFRWEFGSMCNEKRWRHLQGYVAGLAGRLDASWTMNQFQSCLDVGCRQFCELDGAQTMKPSEESTGSRFLTCEQLIPITVAAFARVLARLLLTKCSSANCLENLPARTIRALLRTSVWYLHYAWTTWYRLQPARRVAMTRPRRLELGSALRAFFDTWRLPWIRRAAS